MTASKWPRPAARREGGSSGCRCGRCTRDEQRAGASIDAGLVVEDVSGAAERAGIEAGDVLLAINGKPVQSIEQVKGVLQAQPKSVALLVQRDGEQIFVPVNRLRHPRPTPERRCDPAPLIPHQQRTAMNKHTLALMAACAASLGAPPTRVAATRARRTTPRSNRASPPTRRRGKLRQAPALHCTSRPLRSS